VCLWWRPALFLARIAMRDSRHPYRSFRRRASEFVLTGDPENEHPFFLTPEERDLAEGVQRPLHDTRFTSLYPRGVGK